MSDDFEVTEGLSGVTIDDIVQLYTSVGWSAYTDHPDKLMSAVQNSTYVVTCRHGGKLIGLARSLSDDSAIHYIQDILVDPVYQRKGIGRKLIEHCMKRLEHVRAHVLLTDDQEYQHKFYESLGFKNTRTLKKHPLNAFVKFRGVEVE